MKHSILGAATLLHGHAPFDRAPLVLSIDADHVLEVSAYLDDGEIVGKTYSRNEFAAMVSSECAVLLPTGIKATKGAALWVLRDNFTGRLDTIEELIASGVMLRSVRVSDSSIGCLVREDADALAMRDRWARSADVEAYDFARQQRWEDAFRAVQRALALERYIIPQRIAMAILVCERLGRHERASGYRTMAMRSVDETFVKVIDRVLRALDQHL